MRSCVLLALTAGLLVAAEAADDTAKKELQKFQGTWTVTSAVISGKDEETLKNAKVIVEKDQFTIEKDNKVTGKGTMSFDTSKKRKILTIKYTEGPRKGDTRDAIYEMDGDKAKVCTNLKGIPSEFSSTAENKNFLIMGKRTKP